MLGRPAASILLLLTLVRAYGEDEVQHHHHQQTSELPSIYYTEPSGSVQGSGLYNPSSNSIEQGFQGLTELHGGKIARGRRTLEKTKSPYVLKEDLYVERGAELFVEPGVEVRFAPTIGITVRGAILALGEANRPILLTSTEGARGTSNEKTVRLVDGPSPLEGRLQIFHKDEWRSVCTNSRNWTKTDLETACRQLGYQGGRWWNWMDREWPAKPRLLYEQPQCQGGEAALEQCGRWSNRMLGAGVCEYHPDLGIACSPYHDHGTGATRHWRGLKFEGAAFDRPLIQENTLYVRRSKSVLRHVEIRYAGTGRDYNVTSALQVEGVPPQMDSISIVNSAYTGINVTVPEAPVVITNCTVQNSKGYGIYVNSSTGQALVDGCVIVNNDADGVKYVHYDERPDESLNRAEVFDLCTFPTTGQTFPITIFVEQNRSPSRKSCPKHIYTQPGHVLTLQFLQMKTDRNDSAYLEVYDGSTPDGKLLARVNVRNGTLPQSVTSTRQDLYVVFKAEPRTQMVAYMRITSGYQRVYDLNVTSSTIADNNGRGIAAERLRSGVFIEDTSISNNRHVAGVHVLHGVPHVNISNSRIAFNRGDGVNITVTGGSRNISRSSISSNRGFGFATWLNDSSVTEYIAFNQTTTLEHSQIFKNRDVGFLVSNATGTSYVNISSNSFNASNEIAVKIGTAWRPNNGILYLQIGHNHFVQNNKIGVKISPALNVEGAIEYNRFTDHQHGCILIRNPLLEEFNILSASLLVQHNEFYENRGPFVVSLGLSPYSDLQRMLFTRNFLKNNRVREPFDADDSVGSSKLIPRSRVAAVAVISSANVKIFRNIFNNPESTYEIGSHFEDQSKIINCTYNWLSSGEQPEIFERLFHRKDRYNLAKIEYIPYLLHSSNPATTTINPNPTFVARFLAPGTNIVGGEVDGKEVLKAGEYIVKRDINVRPGGELILEPGVTLRFPPAVGMMVAGRLDAHGTGPSNILMTLKEEIVYSTGDNDSSAHGEDIHDTMIVPVVEENNNVPVRLLGGKTSREGRLQVRVGDKWGTVCNYGWTVRDAALVCSQLGLTLDPANWFMERSQIPNAGTNEPIVLSNVRCTEDDNDITKCRSESVDEFENSCTHENDVGVRCSEAAWAGLRLGPLAVRSDLQFITIERAGLLDYSTNSFKPALQIDFARHSLEGVKVVNNLQDGLGVLYSDIYSADAVNMVRNSDFSENRGSGISFKQLGLRIMSSRLENNGAAGIRHNPALSGVQQREFAGWFVRSPDTSLDSMYEPYLIPDSTRTDIVLTRGETKYLLTSRVFKRPSDQILNIICDPGYVIGIQLLNPIHNRSTEEIIIHDSPIIKTSQGYKWNLKRDLTVFPTSSNSYKIVFEYHSGENALGGAVIVLTSLPTPNQETRNRGFRGPIPTLRVTKTKIRGNRRGVHASYYNRYLDEVNDHFLRKANESIQLLNCEITHNAQEAIYLHSPYWNIYNSNLSEISIHLNNSLVTDNGKGIMQYSRDMRQSNNLFHWVIKDSTIERNQAGGFEIALPYVWQYNENYTHSIYLDNNTWQSNDHFAFIVDGHYTVFNMSNNRFSGNRCKGGLISIRGMEKKMKIDGNRIERNFGDFMVEFKADSQSEILGEVFARFAFNEVRQNSRNQPKGGVGKNGLVDRLYELPTCVVGFHGIQKVRVNRNLFGGNSMDYELVAGIRTAKINNEVDVRENWWGTDEDSQIKKRIFDFDDWNDHAVANFRPYLVTDSFDSSISPSFAQQNQLDPDNLGGRIVGPYTLGPRERPYMIRSDITVMPDSVLTIRPGVVLEFAPNVGILVLGTLKAKGVRGAEIQMRPMKSSERSAPRKRENEDKPEMIRLCKNERCSSNTNEGFLEYFNRTTLQWVPICDSRFTERNAQVACRQLGHDPLNVYAAMDRRYELHPGSLTRIWSWPEPIQCSGKESNLEDCQIRLNGQLYGHRYECPWDGNFVFLHCGVRNLDTSMNYWGGIRIANSEFEHYAYEYRIHDTSTHMSKRPEESVLRYVNITGAGILHNERSAAIQSIMKSPNINYVTVRNSAYHGINMISPTQKLELLVNRVHNALGNGINILSLTGEGREADESSFTPLRDMNFPYHLFSLIDICDTTKEIVVEERVLLYYKYDNNPVNCVKILRSSHRAKPFGFRLLQFNLFNSTGKLAGRPDSITLYDGDIYNITAPKIEELNVNSPLEKRMFRTTGPSLSVKLFATGASSVHGFIAEIVTIPISAIVFNRDVQHNVSYTVISKCREGAFKYASVGEVNAVITLERNQFVNNCEKLYGNFSTCKSAIYMDLQNTQSLYFRNNLVMKNQGGLFIRADSRGTATALKGWIHNNLFAENYDKPTLYIEGRESGPYQEVTIFRNYFTKNNATYENNIVLKQVVSNMTLNYLRANLGKHLLEISGFERVRLPIYQSTTHNGFYENFATDRDGRSTVVAGTPGQQYVDNIFFNPDNDYELLTINRSIQFQMWRSSIDARHNYWSYNKTSAVAGRIRDRTDSIELLEVDFEPFHMNNQSVLGGKCPPAWDLVGDTCYIYIGAPMNFYEAREFCKVANASIPFVRPDYLQLWKFLHKQQERFIPTERVWVQELERIDQCTMFTWARVEIDRCNALNPFICEIDPRIQIDPLSWTSDLFVIGALGAVVFLILCMSLAGVFCFLKSRKRKEERFVRRNSIRQSINSLRSIGSTTGFSELSHTRRKPIPTKSTDTLNSRNGTLDYKKMSNGGSIESMDKSQLNSSLSEDNHCYDVYEAHNPRYSPGASGVSSYATSQPATYAADNPGYTLTYRNEGYRNHSTFGSRSNSGWPSEINSCTTPDDLAHIVVNPDANTSGLPQMDSSLGADSISELKRELQRCPPTPLSEPLPEYYSAASTMTRPYYYNNNNNNNNNNSIGLHNGLGYVNNGHQHVDEDLAQDHRPRSDTLLETNFDEERPLRSKSAALLETNFDDHGLPMMNGDHLQTELAHLSVANRSKSQPLETAM